ncbi:MAG: glutathione S-transferase [Pseudomonadota bacterium]
MPPTLHIFPYSNFCEKAVWALDAFGQPYERRLHFAGPHARAVKKLSGQTAVPVLENGQRITAGSASIIELFSESAAYDRLVPTSHRAEIMEWQARLDGIGATLRGTLFYQILPHRTLAIRLLSGRQKAPWGGYGLFFRAFTPVLMSMLRKNMPDQATGLSACRPVLDDIAQAAGDGYLVGDQFTLADLTAAAIFYPICHPAGSLGHEVTQAEPQLAKWHALWADHPAIAYVQRIYTDHRRAKA